MKSRSTKDELTAARRRRVSQHDVPFYPLTQAMRVPNALADQLGLKPARPIQVAQALGVQPTSSGFRMLCGSSIAYGLTEGGYNAAEISLTDLGRRVVAPSREGDDANALREAFLRPRVVHEFLGRYDSAKVPRADVARNVLADMGVPRNAGDRVLTMILEGARGLGLLREIGGAQYVDLQGTRTLATGLVPEQGGELEDLDVDEESCEGPGLPANGVTPVAPRATVGKTRVFISHGRYMEVVAQIKTMLNVAEVEYEVAVEEEATAIPVPEKVLDAMRKCNSAVICVTADSTGSPGTAESVARAVNQNVLIEIGAAFVLYEKRVVLLWDKRIPVPSNLQGLYRCEFEGAELSWSVGMKLMEAVKKFRI